MRPLEFAIKVITFGSVPFKLEEPGLLWPDTCSGEALLFQENNGETEGPETGLEPLFTVLVCFITLLIGIVAFKGPCLPITINNINYSV